MDALVKEKTGRSWAEKHTSSISLGCSTRKQKEAES
jgi:hypothetical protein